jgi:hypothetical protein
LKRIKELERRKDQNILELKVDKILTDGAAVMKGLEMDEFVTTIIKKIILSEALNSPSSRFFSFFNPALLNFPNRNVKILQNSS